MHLKTRSSLLIPGTFSLSVAAAAIAASCLGMAAAHSFRSIVQSHSIQVNLTEFSWWSQIKLGVDRLPDEVAVAQLPPKTDASIADSGAQVAQSRVTSAPARTKKIKRIQNARVQKLAAAKSTVTTHEKLVVTQANSLPPVHQVASDAEKQNLQNVYGLLRNRFRVAVNQAPVTTQVLLAEKATISDSEPALTIQPKAIVRRQAIQQNVTKAAPKPKKRRALSQVRKSRSNTTPVSQPRAVAKALPVEPAISAKPKAISSQQSSTQVNLQLSQSNDSQNLSMASSSMPETSQHLKPSKPTETQLEPLQSDLTQATAQMATVESSAALEKPKGHDESVASKSTSETESTQKHQQASPDHLAVVGPALATQTRSVQSDALTTQKSAQVRDYSNESRDYSQLDSRHDAVENGSSSVQSTRALLPRGVSSSDPAIEAIEAFEWKSGVPGAMSEVITHEGHADRSHGKWIQVEAEDYLPSLAWKAGSKEEHSPVPLISRNTARLLATMAGTRLLPETGIVFGKIARGWTVEFSGRAEKVVIVDENNAPVSADVIDRDRYFAFVNAAPGSHLLHAVSLEGSTRAAVFAPTFEGRATHVDLSRVRTRPFNGKVLDGSSHKMKHVAGATVRVLGQPSQSALTDRYGNFRFEEVIAFGDQPIFVEAEAKGGFPHRYKITPNQQDPLQLFTFRNEQIQVWLGQLEGGLSPQSGLLIGVYLGQPKSFSKDELLPKLLPLHANSTLLPETYTLAPNDQLQVKLPLEAESPRFLSVQIPEGANLAVVEDSRKNVIWSDLIVASPGVVNVIGPK